MSGNARWGVLAGIVVIAVGAITVVLAQDGGDISREAKSLRRPIRNRARLTRSRLRLSACYPH